VAALLYYMRDQPLKILAWPSPDVPTFDMTRPLTKEARQPIVFLTECESAKRLAVHYANVEKTEKFIRLEGRLQADITRSFV
jgi:hypothetical protein